MKLWPVASRQLWNSATAANRASPVPTSSCGSVVEVEVVASVAEFQSCLDATGHSFIGLPDPSLGADAPENAGPYIDALIDCAARSQIQERLAEADAAQADLTPEEVEAQNRQYVAFRDCMIGRGWDIPEPVPNEFGLLFPGFAQAAGWQGPPGEDITTTDDVGECTDAAGVEL